MPIVLCQELSKKTPEWVQILPKGPTIKGIDGRKWKMSNPERLIDMFKSMGLPLVVDYEHASEIKATEGNEAPAAGWVEDLELRNDGEVWAKVDWNERAKTSINSREYRFISPAFNHDSSGEIVSLSSVGLTNKPNLIMQALNRQDSSSINDSVNWGVLSKSLGVSVSSSDELISALNAREESERNKEAETLVDDLIAKAIFTPAQKEFLIATCRSQGREELEKFASTFSGFSYLAKDTLTKADLNNQSNLSSLQLSVCQAVGVSEKQFLNYINKSK
ncbi:TPA: phage protease [Photobacterium damselae]